MNDEITKGKLKSIGFADTIDTLIADCLLSNVPMRDYRKGNLVIRLHGTDRFAWTWAGEKIGPVTTMHEVEVLDGIINPLPPDAITAEKLIEAGFSRIGENAFNHESIRLVPRTGTPRTYCVYYRSGDFIGYAVNMTEVKSLADVTSRRI